MWHEFADDLAVYDINSQFMIGSGILFAPKVIAKAS
jgi:alpha-glucosidase (family GH31 glycosyl hydrolase)